MRHIQTFIEWIIVRFIYGHPHLKNKKVNVQYDYRQNSRYYAKCISWKEHNGYHHVLKFKIPNMLFLTGEDTENTVLHECIHMLSPAAHHGKRFQNLCKKHNVPYFK